MAQRVTVVMYHYVRNLENSRYPGIAGLPTSAFRKQVEWVQQHFNFISGSDLLEAVAERTPLPESAALLTFDDGYADHFTQVLPILDELGIPGCFFPPAKCILEREILDVNKIHYILAATDDVDALIDYTEAQIRSNRAEFDLESVDVYRKRLAVPGRFDSKEVVYLKRLLQRELPELLRRQIVADLFDQFVEVEESVLAEELYMTLDQVRMLNRQGMYVGSHGYDHYWLNHLTPDEQRREVVRSMNFLEEIGTPLDRWIMCYPYGAHDESIRSLLPPLGCTVGLATQVGIADLKQDDPLALPRVDTNDISTDLSAKAWMQEEFSLQTAG